MARKLHLNKEFFVTGFENLMAYKYLAPHISKGMSSLSIEDGHPRFSYQHRGIVLGKQN